MTPSYCIADPASPMRSTLAAAFSQPAGRRAARVHFSYVIELDPTFVDAYVNRAALRLDIGDLVGAEQDVADGLGLAPDHAHLHCLRGLVAAEHDDRETA